MITNYLTKDNMQHVKSVNEWEEAIKLAAKPLLKKKDY